MKKQLKSLCIIFLIRVLLCEPVQVLWVVHCKCQDRTKCVRNLVGKIPMWKKMGGWKEGHLEKLRVIRPHSYSLSMKEGGRECYVKTSYTTVQFKKVLARLFGSSWHKVSHQRRPMSPTNRSALVSVLLSHWLGAVASVKIEMAFFWAWKLRTLVSYTPCSRKSTRWVLTATTLWFTSII